MAAPPTGGGSLQSKVDMLAMILSAPDGCAALHRVLSENPALRLQLATAATTAEPSGKPTEAARAKARAAAFGHGVIAREMAERAWRQRGGNGGGGSGGGGGGGGGGDEFAWPDGPAASGSTAAPPTPPTPPSAAATPAKPPPMEQLASIMAVPANRECADCNATKVAYANVSFGVFVCQRW